MSRSSDLSKRAKRYILDQIDNSGHSNIELKTDQEKIDFLKATFLAEYGWKRDQVGECVALAEYYAGLPSACTIAFFNVDIIDIAKAWGSLPDESTEKQEQKIIDSWFNFLACKTCQMFRGNFS